MTPDSEPEEQTIPAEPGTALNWGERFMGPPQPLTALVGREREMALVARLVTDHARLVTLTGPPGVGKTRLAVQVGVSLVDSFRDGVAWIPLSQVQQASQVIPTIGRHLGLVGAVDLHRLSLVLQHAQLMLVLDNLEQLPDVGGVLVSLLERCSQVVIVATSRTLLRVSGEYTIRLQPLELPSFTRTTTPADILASNAVQLFVERAQAIDANFEVNDESAWIAGDICSRVEGLPLAIELLVARLAYLPLATLRDGLQHRLPFLTSVALDRPSRQRTMRNAIAWSYELLSPDEKFCFRTLAIYMAGFRLEAVVHAVRYLHGARAEAFSSPANDADIWAEALEMVATLSNHSLLRTEVDSDGAPRYHMLEILREFALEQLDAASERTTAEHLRATSVSQLATHCETAPFVPDGVRWLNVMTTEQVDIRQALAWMCEAGQWSAAQDVAGMLANGWMVRGHLNDSREWLELIVEHCPSDSSLSRVRVLVGLGMTCHLQGKPEQAAHYMTAALEIGQHMGGGLWYAMSLMGNGVLASWSGELDKARSWLEQARMLAGTLPESALANYLESSTIANLGVVTLLGGDREGAESLFLEALALRRREGYELGMGRVLSDLGVVSIELGRLEAACDYFAEALVLAEKLRDSRLTADILAGLTRVAIAMNNMGSARRLQHALGVMQGLSGITSRRVTARAVLADAQMDALLFDDADGHEDDATLQSTWPMDEALLAVAELQQRAGGTESQSRATVAYGLTPREVEVLREVARHQTDREIAEILYISRRTVGFHVTSILKKLGVESRRLATSKAISEDLVS